MPYDKSLSRMRTFVEKYLDKTGTSRHQNANVTEAVINGLASNLDELGRPLCPCKFFPDKKAEVERSREWVGDVRGVGPRSVTDRFVGP